MTSVKHKDQINGQGTTTSEPDITQLASFLSREPSDQDADVAELLRRIDEADGMAEGVESKLDDMLDNLDNLLASLEPEVAANKSSTDSMPPGDS
jgi:hypothetical protein